MLSLPQLLARREDLDADLERCREEFAALVAHRERLWAEWHQVAQQIHSIEQQQAEEHYRQ